MLIILVLTLDCIFFSKIRIFCTYFFILNRDQYSYCYNIYPFNKTLTCPNKILIKPDNVTPTMFWFPITLGLLIHGQRTHLRTGLCNDTAFSKKCRRDWRWKEKGSYNWFLHHFWPRAREKQPLEPVLCNCVCWGKKKFPRVGTGIWLTGVHAAPCELARLLEKHSGLGKQNRLLAAALLPIKTSSYYGKPGGLASLISHPAMFLSYDPVSPHVDPEQRAKFSFLQTYTTKPPLQTDWALIRSKLL